MPHTRPIASVVIQAPNGAQALNETRQLLRDYANGVTQTGCFEAYEAELAALDRVYAHPHGGLFLAYVNGQPAGCCGFRPLLDTDHTNACEMKRLYVAPAFRGMGLGYQLARAVMDAARTSGYSCMLLDTLDEMEAARALYGVMGFAAIPPFAPSPVAGAHHLRVDL